MRMSVTSFAERSAVWPAASARRPDLAQRKARSASEALKIEAGVTARASA